MYRSFQHVRSVGICRPGEQSRERIWTDVELDEATPWFVAIQLMRDPPSDWADVPYKSDLEVEPVYAAMASQYCEFVDVLKADLEAGEMVLHVLPPSDAIHKGYRELLKTLKDHPTVVIGPQVLSYLQGLRDMYQKVRPLHNESDYRAEVTGALKFLTFHLFEQLGRAMGRHWAVGINTQLVKKCQADELSGDSITGVVGSVRRSERDDWVDAYVLELKTRARIPPQDVQKLRLLYDSQVKIVLGERQRSQRGRKDTERAPKETTLSITYLSELPEVTLALQTVDKTLRNLLRPPWYCWVHGVRTGFAACGAPGCLAWTRFGYKPDGTPFIRLGFLMDEDPEEGVTAWSKLQQKGSVGEYAQSLFAATCGEMFLELTSPHSTAVPVRPDEPPPTASSRSSWS